MAISDSQKRARDKWDRENMVVLGCKVKKADADAFRAYCKSVGKSANTVLKELVDMTISDNRTSD